MTFEAFRNTLSDANPPAVTPPLIALWHDARGDWDKAHQVAQDVDDETGAWVHAYLHRKEATCRTPLTGIAARTSRLRLTVSNRSGLGSSPRSSPTLRYQLSALSSQLSALSFQLSALSTQHSALSTQHSALSTEH